jgi:hypothetical protein
MAPLRCSLARAVDELPVRGAEPFERHSNPVPVCFLEHHLIRIQAEESCLDAKLAGRVGPGADGTRARVRGGRRCGCDRGQTSQLDR